MEIFHILGNQVKVGWIKVGSRKSTPEPMCLNLFSFLTQADALEHFFLSDIAIGGLQKGYFSFMAPKPHLWQLGSFWAVPEPC